MPEPDDLEGEKWPMGPPPRPSAPGPWDRAGRWLARQLEAERERWVLWLPVAFGASPWWLLPLGLAALALFLRLAGRRADDPPGS